jgi:hypothetical protein
MQAWYVSRPRPLPFTFYFFIHDNLWFDVIKTHALYTSLLNKETHFTKVLRYLLKVWLCISIACNVADNMSCLTVGCTRTEPVNQAHITGLTQQALCLGPTKEWKGEKIKIKEWKYENLIQNKIQYLKIHFFPQKTKFHCKPACEVGSAWEEHIPQSVSS